MYLFSSPCDLDEIECKENITEAECITAIKAEDFVIVAKYVMEGLPVTETLLREAVKLDSSGILRVLLSSENANPNSVLSESIVKKNSECCTALLEDPRIIFDVCNGIVTALSLACSCNRPEIVFILLDHQLVPNTLLYNYVVDSIKMSTTDSLKILISDRRFNPVANKSIAIISACEMKSVEVLDLLLSHPLCDLSLNKEEVLLAGVKSYNSDIFGALLRKGGFTNVPTSVVVECMKPGKMCAFKELLQVSSTQVKAFALKNAIKNKSKVHTEAIYEHDAALDTVFDSKSMCECVDSKATVLLDFMLERQVESCDKSIINCAASHAINHRMDLSASLILRQNRCDHFERLLQPALTNSCNKSSLYIAANMILTDVHMRNIVMSRNIYIIRTVLLLNNKVSPSVIHEMLIDKHFEIVSLICSIVKDIDYSWSDYKLLRTASSDSTNKSFTSLNL